MNGPRAIASVRDALLELHEALLTKSRIDYERTNGRVETNGELLTLVAYDEAFDWLHPVSQLIVRFDDEDDIGDVNAARASVQALLEPSSSFGGRYFEVLQSTPDAVLAHARLMRTLQSATPARYIH